VSIATTHSVSQIDFVTDLYPAHSIKGGEKKEGISAFKGKGTLLSFCNLYFHFY
jgi:hypothetical protein